MEDAAVEYIAARRTLLDALDALVGHRGSLVLIGAQAVHFHTGSQGMAVPPMTTDADIVLDADLLAESPEIAATMQGAGFEPTQPGHWQNKHGIAVDLMVAPHQANRDSTKARAANLTPHAKTAARIAPGLAPALADNSFEAITALDRTDTRKHEIRVAGPAALLVAKTIKIEDRLADATRGNSKRIVDKDALDILRLLRATPTATLAARLMSHAASTPARVDVDRSLQVLRARATERDHDLPVLAHRASGDDPTVPASLAVLVHELLESVA